MKPTFEQVISRIHRTFDGRYAVSGFGGVFATPRAAQNKARELIARERAAAGRRATEQVNREIARIESRQKNG